MATLTSCSSFSRITFRCLLSPPIEYNLRDRIHSKGISFKTWNSNDYYQGINCVLYGGRMNRISSRNFGKIFRRTSCGSSSNSDYNGGNKGEEDEENTNLATVTSSKEEGEERSEGGNDFDPENSQVSFSSRVILAISIFHLS